MRLDRVEQHGPTFTANVVPSKERGIFIASYNWIGGVILLHGIEESDAEKLQAGRTNVLRRYAVQLDDGEFLIQTAAELIKESDNSKVGISNQKIYEFARHPRLRT